MNETILTTIAITGFGIAFFHAAIPTHWLPFVLAARVQQWGNAKTLAITALAGSGHVLMTAILGLVATWCGMALSESIGGWFPRIAGALLVSLGLYYVVRQLRGKGHVHFAYPHEHLHEVGLHTEHEPKANFSTRTSDRVAITSLLALLTLSPCEAFIPIYVSGIRHGWAGFVLLTVILSAGTVAGMVLFTGLTLAGTKRLQLGLLEKYESALMGVLLCIVGVLILVFEK